MLICLLTIVTCLHTTIGQRISIDQEGKCTSIAAGKEAMVDHSVVTTHNADCMECDFRITRVPSRDWPKNSKRPIYDIRAAYPRYIEVDDLNNIHGPDNLNSTIDFRIYNWTTSKPFFNIPQVAHTFAYTMGTYGIQNEKQVSIGESTCGAVFSSTPIFASSGKAALHMGVLTEIALERCDTARCAVQTMGDLATKYGFYGPSWDSSSKLEALSEAGEALTISDTEEAWMFHILPDDTGISAVWAAQRVPDGHITAVANQFVVTEIDFDDRNDFMFSTNIVQVALRSGLWTNHSTSSSLINVKRDSVDYMRPFNFLKVYGQNIGASGYQATRRVWRVFTLAAPSLLNELSPFTDPFGTFGYGPNGTLPYPFSVKVDRPLSVRDIMTMNRDQYEGTPFDMSTGLDAGPFGDPMRFRPLDVSTDPVHGISAEQYRRGLMYNRAISIARTSYSTVTQSRGAMPDIVGAITWVAQYAPHHSSFTPIYAHGTSIPMPLRNGSLHKVETGSLWWVHAITGNYLSRWYKHTIADVKEFQTQLEDIMFARQNETEMQALAVLDRSDIASHIKTEEVTKLLTNMQDSVAKETLSKWWDFFYLSVVRYRDMYRIDNVAVDNIATSMQFLTLPRLWFEMMGYWGPPFTPPPGTKTRSTAGGGGSSDTMERLDPIYPVNVPTEPTLAAYTEKYPNGMYAPYVLNANLFLDTTTSDVATPSPVSTDKPEGGVMTSRTTTRRDHACEVSEYANLSFLLLMCVIFGVAVGFIMSPVLDSARGQGTYRRLK